MDFIIINIFSFPVNLQELLQEGSSRVSEGKDRKSLYWLLQYNCKQAKHDQFRILRWDKKSKEERYSARKFVNSLYKFARIYYVSQI